jgi:hypothetical protein
MYDRHDAVTKRMTELYASLVDAIACIDQANALQKSSSGAANLHAWTVMNRLHREISTAAEVLPQIIAMAHNDFDALPTANSAPIIGYESEIARLRERGITSLRWVVESTGGIRDVYLYPGPAPETLMWLAEIALEVPSDDPDGVYLLDVTGGRAYKVADRYSTTAEDAVVTVGVPINVS